MMMNGFNRYIVECKFTRLSNSNINGMDLIDT